MPEPKRINRILEGLTTQAIWQVLSFFASAGFLSWGMAKLTHPAQALVTAVNVFLVVVGLAGIVLTLGVVLRRKRNYPKADIVEKIVIIAEPIGTMIYINQHREAIEFPFLTLRNFSEVDLELEPIDVQIVGSSRTFGMTRARYNSARVAKLGGQSQVTLAFYSLTAKDLEFIETTCKRPGYFDLNLLGTLRIKASDEWLDVPFGVTVRAGVQRL